MFCFCLFDLDSEVMYDIELESLSFSMYYSWYLNVFFLFCFTLFKQDQVQKSTTLNPTTSAKQQRQHKLFVVPFFFSEVWHFPSDNEPADLNSDDPNPASWDPERLLTWFPFDAWI